MRKIPITTNKVPQTRVCTLKYQSIHFRLQKKQNLTESHLIDFTVKKWPSHNTAEQFNCINCRLITTKITQFKSG